MLPYTMETHSEIVNFSHTQIFLFRLKSRKTSTHFTASGLESVFCIVCIFFQIYYSSYREFFILYNFPKDSIEKTRF